MTAWSGRGWLVAICNVVGFAVAFLVLKLTHPPLSLISAVLFAVWGAVSGLGVYFWSQRIEAEPPQMLRDLDTNQRVEVPADAGTFTWVPTRHWAWINPVFGVVVAGLAATGVSDFFRSTELWALLATAIR